MNTDISQNKPAAAPDDPYGNKAFLAYYQEEIQPLLTTLEKHRSTALAEHKKRRPKALFLAILLGTPILAFGSIPLELRALLALLIVIFAAIWCGSPKRHFSEKVRDRIFPVVFRFFGEDFHYAPIAPKKLRKEILTLCNRSLLFKKNNRATIGTFVSGNYKGISFFSAELRLNFRKNFNGPWRNLFDGTILLFHLSTNPELKVVVRKDGGLLGNLVDIGLTRIRLEDPIFEKTFEVYGNDQIGARTFLTPSFMSRLLHLDYKYCKNQHPPIFEGVDTIQCCFLDASLMVFLPGSSLFRFTRTYLNDCENPLSIGKETRAIRNQMEIVFGMIDDLNLSGNTGLWGTNVDHSAGSPNLMQ